jgi:pimeloyl-ACP methyl ester carboxylesterase
LSESISRAVELSWSGHRLHAGLHLPPGPPPGTVQLLLPGLTYDSRYWTLPGPHDYVAAQLAAGHAVLALDRIGTGRSDRPPAADVTVEANLDAVHEVVAAIRGGALGIEVTTVVAVGHSLGSGLAVLEAARHRDLDALVLTGLLHDLGPAYWDVVPALHPAAEDPVLGPDQPDGYLTTRPGARSELYEHAGAVDEELAKWHEETKTTVTLGEGMTLEEIYAPDAAAAVTVPVLVVIGARDRLFGGGAVDPAAPWAVRGFESSFYCAAPVVEAIVVPDAGHALNVHRDAADWYAAAARWIGAAT